MTYKRKEVIGPHTLYLGDCLEVMPTLGRFDACVTDPPYGVSGVQNTKTAKNRGGRKNDYTAFLDSLENVKLTVVPAIVFCIENFNRVIVTPGNRCLNMYPNPDSFGAVYQPASVGLQPWGRADAQPILYYGKSPHGGQMLPGQKCSWVNTKASEYNGHPCPKPLGLIKNFILAASRIGDSILDPFMGSGTTGVACQKLGRVFTGIEIDPGYFDIACKRIDEAMRQPDLFVETPQKPEQTTFDLEAAE